MNAVHFSRAGVADGARTALPLAVGAGIFGAALGVLAAAKGIGTLEIGLMSALVFAGASQVVSVEIWSSPMPVAAILVATLAINSRHLLMSATLSPWLGQMRTPQALGCCFLLVDESWALSVVRQRAGATDAGFLVGAGLALYACWVGGTLLGHGLGALVPDPARFGLDFLGVAVFLCLLILLRPGRADVVPLVVAAVATLDLAAVLPGKWHVLLGALAGALAAALGPQPRGEPS